MNESEEQSNDPVTIDLHTEEFVSAISQSHSIISPPPPSPLFVAGVVALYFVVSMSVVLLNKTITVNKSFKFPYPLTSTWIQLVVALFCLYSMSVYKSSGRNMPFDVPRFSINKSTAMAVLPLTVVYVGMLAFNNICLMMVPVSMYQVARSQTLTFNLIMTYFVLGKRTSSRAAGACAIIMGGYLLGVTDSIELTATGIVFGLLSSFFVAMYNLNTERVLPAVNGNQWALSMYNTALAIPILLPIAAMFEWGPDLFDASVLLSPAFLTTVLGTSFMGFSISIVMILQIKYTSGLTAIVSGTAKSAVQSIIGYYLFAELLTTSEIVSCFTVVIGGALYSYVRFSERKAVIKSDK